jgi:hypothetical protein
MKRSMIVAGLAGLALAIAPLAASQASVSPVTRYTQAGAAASSGYFTNEFGGTFTHIQGYIGSNATTSLEQLTPAVTNGVGLGLCNQGTGEAVQLGDVYLGGGLMNVDYTLGTFGAAKWFGDRCANGLVAAPTGILLAGISVTDTVDGQILYDSHHSHNGCPAGDVRFEAEDLTNPGVAVPSPCTALPAGTNFNEGDAGVVADTTARSAPADNLLVVFAHLGLTDGAGLHGSFQANSAWTAYPVDSTANGTKADPALLAPGKFSADHFNENAGSPTG